MWKLGDVCVCPPHGIGRIQRVSPSDIALRIETPGLVIEGRTPSSFAFREIEAGTELIIRTQEASHRIRMIASAHFAEELARVLQNRDLTGEALPKHYPDRMAALREAFAGPLEVSVRWLRRFRASESEDLSFGERRALRVLERLVSTEIELARSAAFGR